MQKKKFFKSISKLIKNNHLLSFILKNFLYINLCLLFKTYRLEVVIDKKTDLPLNKWEGIFYFWHQNIISAMFFFSKQNSIGHSIVSPSKDGKIIGYILKKLGFKIVYGSKYKESIKLVRQGLDILDTNKKLCIVGDGSRGPAFKLQRGVIYMAAKSQLPLIFVDCKPQSAIKFKNSWDKFKIPLPFSKIHIHVHHPVMTSTDAYKNFTKNDKQNVHTGSPS